MTSFCSLKISHLLHFISSSKQAILDTVFFILSVIPFSICFPWLFHLSFYFILFLTSTHQVRHKLLIFSLRKILLPLTTAAWKTACQLAWAWASTIEEKTRFRMISTLPAKRWARWWMPIIIFSLLFLTRLCVYHLSVGSTKFTPWCWFCWITFGRGFFFSVLRFSLPKRLNPLHWYLHKNVSLFPWCICFLS